MSMNIKLYKIRDLVAIFSPLYISICAALLIDLKSNIKLDGVSFLYFLGLASFFIACVISNKLYGRCNNYGRIYDIELNEYIKDSKNNTKPCRETIYDKGENRKDKKDNYIYSARRRCFEYNGFLGFGILGLLFIIFSYVFSENQSQQLDNKNIELQNQVDSLKLANIKYEEQIIVLQQESDSNKNIRFKELNTGNTNNIDSINKKVKIK
ncbi:hypothetical protein [Dysgonomonas reticulitermitis]